MNQDSTTKQTIVLFASDHFAKALGAYLESFASVFPFDPLKTALPHNIRPSHLLFLLAPSAQSLRSLKETLYYLHQGSPHTKVLVLGASLDGSFQSQTDVILKWSPLAIAKCNLVGVPGGSFSAFGEAVAGLLNSPPSPLWQHLRPPVDLLPIAKQTPVTTGPQVMGNPRKAIGVGLATVLVFFLLVVGSVLWPLYQAISEIDYVRNNFSTLALTKSRDHLVSAETNFGTSRANFARLASPFRALGMTKTVDDVSNLLELGEEGTGLGLELLDLLPGLQAVALGVSDPQSPTYADSVIYSLGPQLEKVSLGLSRVESKVKNVPANWKVSLIGPNYQRYEQLISESRALSQSMAKLSPTLGTLLGSEERKNYLVVFQNPAEIRATGGFIGSFAIIGFDKGKMVNLLVQDIYEADGQLSGGIAPPDEILYYMGQPNWYMRDANWAIDFPLTARRLEWFLQKETGKKVDGVIAVDVHAIEKLLKATGPIKLTDFDDTIDSTNLFEKIEYQSEINFFPGSTQKRDFLAAVMADFLGTLTSGKLQNPPALLSGLNESLKEKNILFYLDDPVPQEIFAANNWTGAASPETCSIILGKRLFAGPISSCFGFYDSNIGANKANYYLKRSSDALVRIGKAGDIDVELLVHYQNDSPSRTWPGGDYKNYLRFLLPLQSTVGSLTLGDGRVATVSSALNSKILASLPSSQFLVKQSSESSVLELGMLAPIPVGSSGSATISFRLPYQLDFTDPNPELGFTLLKQPGTPVEPWQLTVEYPAFLTPLLDSSAIDRTNTVVFPQKLVYNGALDQDRIIQIRFSNRN